MGLAELVPPIGSCPTDFGQRRSIVSFEHWGSVVGLIYAAFLTGLVFVALGYSFPLGKNPAAIF